MNKLLKAVMISAGVLVSATAVAADYPTKNIRLVVPFGAGGGTDAVGRTLQIVPRMYWARIFRS